MFCYFALHTSRNKDTDECYGKWKQVNQAEAFDFGVGEEVTVSETSATRNKAQQRNMLLSIRRWYFMFDCLCTLSCPFDGNCQNLSSSCKGTYICRNHLEKADEIIGQATPPLFHDFEGLELFHREC